MSPAPKKHLHVLRLARSLKREVCRQTGPQMAVWVGSARLGLEAAAGGWAGPESGPPFT